MRRLCVLAATVAMGCGGGFRTYTPAPTSVSCNGDPGRGGVLAHLERGPCLGTCPVYRIVVCNDGTVVYDGQQFVKASGRKVKRLPPPSLAALVRELDAAPSGPSPLDKPLRQDAPSTDLMCFRAGRKRWLAASAVPAFETAVGSVRWVGTQDERERLSRESR